MVMGGQSVKERRLPFSAKNVSQAFPGLLVRWYLVSQPVNPGCATA